MSGKFCRQVLLSSYIYMDEFGIGAKGDGPIIETLAEFSSLAKDGRGM